MRLNRGQIMGTALRDECVMTLNWGFGSALGGTRTPNLLIRRSMQPVRPVRQNPYPQVSVRELSRPSAWVRYGTASL